MNSADTNRNSRSSRSANRGEADHVYYPGFGLIGYVKYDKERDVWLPYYSLDGVEHLAHKLCEPMIVRKKVAAALDTLTSNLDFYSIAGCRSKESAKAQVRQYFTAEVLSDMFSGNDREN